MGLQDFEASTPSEEFTLSLSGLSDKTQRLYPMALEEFCKFHDTTPKELFIWESENQTSVDTKNKLRMKRAFEKFRQHLVEVKGLNPNTAQNYKKAVNKFLTSNGLNPIPSERGKTVGSKSSRSITKDQIRDVIDHAKTDLRARALIYTMKDTGLRVGDIAQLTIEYFNNMRRKTDEKGNEFRFWSDELRTQKAKINAHICLGPESIKSLKNYIGTRETGAIFLTITTASDNSMVITKGPRKGERITRRGSEAGQPMRKTAITNLLINRSKPLRNRNIKVSAQSLRKFFLNAWTSKGLDKYGKLFAGKSLGRNDGAYIATENGELEKLYMENYTKVLGLEDNGALEEVETLQKKIEGLEANLDDTQSLLVKMMTALVTNGATEDKVPKELVRERIPLLRKILLNYVETKEEKKGRR